MELARTKGFHFLESKLVDDFSRKHPKGIRKEFQNLKLLAKN